MNTITYKKKMENTIQNKNAFQWDAYRPFVDCISACTVAGMGGYLPGGYLPSGWTCRGGGVSARGYLPRGRVPARRVYLPRYSPLWTDRHLWKHNLRKLRLWAVIRTTTVDVTRLLLNCWRGNYTRKCIGTRFERPLKIDWENG